MTHWPDIWVNGENNLWLVNGGNPLYLDCCRVRDVHWTVVATQVCAYCGSENETSRCPNCGGKVTERSIIKAKGATVTVSGYLPSSWPLFVLGEKDRLEVLRRCCGRRDWYESDEVIVRMDNIVVTGRKIPHLVVLDPGDEDALELVVTLNCDARLFVDEERYGTG